MTWFFYECSPQDRRDVIRGHTVYEKANTDLVESAGQALDALSIRPRGERFETMLSEGEVRFAWPNEEILPVVGTKVEGSYPNLKRLG